MWHAGFQTSFFVNSFINVAVWCAALGKGAAREHESADSGWSRLHLGHYAMGLRFFHSHEPQSSGEGNPAPRSTLCRRSSRK